MPGKVSQAQKDRLAALVDLLSPMRSLDRIDTFGKWLFSGLGAVGSLAIGLSVTAFSRPKGLGELTFVLAVAVLGISLACASMALAPALATYNPNSLSDMQGAVADVLKRRWKIVRLATFGFVVTLLLAGLTPAADGISIGREASHLIINYQLSETGILTVQVTGQHLQPFTPLVGQVKPVPGCPAGRAAPVASSAVTNSSGGGRVSLRYVVRPGALAAVSITWTRVAGGAATKSIKVGSPAEGSRCG
jgi:hypothetical protein